MKAFIIETYFMDDKKPHRFEIVKAKNLDNLRARLLADMKNDVHNSIRYMEVWTDKTTPEYISLWHKNSFTMPRPKCWGSMLSTNYRRSGHVEWGTDSGIWYLVNNDGSLGRRL